MRSRSFKLFDSKEQLPKICCKLVQNRNYWLFPKNEVFNPYNGVRAILKGGDTSQFESHKSWWADLEAIRATDYNLTIGGYCPHQAEAVKYERPAILIKRRLSLNG